METSEPHPGLRCLARIIARRMLMDRRRDERRDQGTSEEAGCPAVYQREGDVESGPGIGGAHSESDQEGR